MTKEFKIGEYAVGGIIKVTITRVLKIEALDYNTKKLVESHTLDKDDNMAIDDCLNELTSSYYADKVLTWIKANR